MQLVKYEVNKQARFVTLLVTTNHTHTNKAGSADSRLTPNFLCFHARRDYHIHAFICIFMQYFVI